MPNQNTATIEDEALSASTLNDTIANRTLDSIKSNIPTADDIVLVAVDTITSFANAANTGKDAKELQTGLCDKIVYDFQRLYVDHQIAPFKAWEMIADAAGIAYNSVNTVSGVTTKIAGKKCPSTLSTLTSRIRKFHDTFGDDFATVAGHKGIVDALKPEPKTELEKAMKACEKLSPSDIVRLIDSLSSEAVDTARAAL
jgi:hypothetical protein